MAVFYFRDAYGVVRPSDTSETFYVRDCYGVAFPSTALPIYIRDAYGNIVLSNASPLYVRDANGVVVDSSSVAPTVIDAYGNRVSTSTGTVVWAGGVFPGTGGIAPRISAIDTEGWRATWASGTPPTFTPDTSPEYVPLTRKGYGTSPTTTGSGASTAFVLLTNISESLIINRRVRNLYPNANTDTASTVALSKYVYSTDSAGVTNNSTVDSPVPAAAWLTPDRKLIGATIGGTTVPVEVIAFHCEGRAGRFVSGVIFKVSDGTTTIAVPVTSTSISAWCEDKEDVEVFALPSTDISTLANPATITVNCEVYPFIGDASTVLNSTASSVAREFSPRYFRRDDTRAGSPPIAYVATGGSNAAVASGGGVWSTNAATASATPFLTVQGAINAVTNADQSAVTGSKLDGCRVRIKDSTGEAGGAFVLTSAGTSRSADYSALIIERDPTVARANAAVSFGATAYRARLSAPQSPHTESVICFSDVSIKRTGTLYFQGEAATAIRVMFENVNLDNGSNNASMFSGGLGHAYWFGATITNGTGGSLLGQSSAGQHRIMRGISNDLNTGNVEMWINVGCSFTRPGTSGYLDPQKGFINWCNRVTNPSSTGQWISIGTVNTGETISNAWTVKNVIEVCHTTNSTPAAKFAADTPVLGNTYACGSGFNTITGAVDCGRSNFAYDNSTAVRTHTLLWMAGDLVSQLNNKGDVFTLDATHIGNQAFHHGVNCWGNWTQYKVASGTLYSEYQCYPGLGSMIGTSNTTPQAAQSAIWTDYQGTTNSGATLIAGAGGGTYTLAGSSPVLGIVSVVPISYSLNGSARPSTAGAAGAYDA